MIDSMILSPKAFLSIFGMNDSLKVANPKIRIRQKSLTSDRTFDARE